MSKLEDVFTKENLEETFKFSKAASNALKVLTDGYSKELNAH